MGEAEGKGEMTEKVTRFLEERDGKKTARKDECASRRRGRQLERGEEEGGERKQLEYA